MKVIIANRLETLMKNLAGHLREPLSAVLSPETVVVQSAGMAKWISLQMAGYHGIAANYNFPFPNAFVENIFEAFIPEYKNNQLFDKKVLVWKIMELLPTLTNHDDFRTIRKYLGENQDQQRMYRLADKIAQTFDQYLIFRPEMILKWEKGIVGNKNEVWQAMLWRKIIESQGCLHKAALRQKAIEAMKCVPCRPEALPGRLSVFGISYLPSYHLDILVGLSAHLPVRYYYLNPSREFWADIKSAQEIGRFMHKMSKRRSGLKNDQMHLETGNSLLASWGAQGRDFFRLIQDLQVEYEDVFEDPKRDSLLHKVQSDILSLSEPPGENGAKESLDQDDDTIQIHACHSPLREVETLHDVLLNILEKNASMTPEDVLVMTPDIETYGPCIEAVFESREPRIPFSIADRSAVSANTVAGGLMSLLDFAESRFKSGDLLALLDNPAISEKYDMTPENRELIRHWIEQTKIKWGIDENHRQFFDLPSFRQNTWKHGLDRMLAGVIFDGRHPEIYAGILPFGDIESEQTVVLGQLLTFWEKVTDLKKSVSSVLPLQDWCRLLNDILTDFFPSSDEYRGERSVVQEAINELSKQTTLSGYKQDAELSVIRNYLKDALLQSGGSSRFLNGGVSFCAMLPMRSIPFSVICLLGMNSDVFPRRESKTGFNIMENERRAGDRSIRHDDQYLFLECILSARKYLLISYTGLSQTDNSMMLPSVMVSDLLDYLERNYYFDNVLSMSEEIVKNHRLHAFSSAYFEEKKGLFSYSQSNYLCACAIKEDKTEKKVFLKESLVAPDSPEKTITVQTLLRFYGDPVRYFLENRLDMKLPDRLWTQTPDSEPFRIDELTAYKIKMDLIQNQIRTGIEQEIFDRKRAEGTLPVGAAGDYLFNDLRIATFPFTRDLMKYLESPSLENLAVNITVGHDQITGTLDNLHSHYRLLYRPAMLKMKDYLGAWIIHLILNAAAPENYPKTSLLIGEDGCWQFEPVSSAKEILKTLIFHYRLGLTKPLKIFPRATWAYATALWQKNKSNESAMDAANAAWRGDESGFVMADSDEITSKICFEGINPIDDDFQKTADDIFRELFCHLKKEGT